MAEEVTTRLRVGIGHDTHRLTAGGPLRLGGIEIPHDFHLVGHSDADVLLHAVTDAVLGAAGLGDIGELFPDHDPANRGRDSADMLSLAFERVRQRGYRMVNADLIVFAEQPKLSRFKPLIENRIAELLDTSSSNINMKAKTGERVGPIGRQEAISAECIVLLEKLGV
jgi:2-C-methyl-D-erythritol 2,4-cyclodiphosphate synthase